MDLTWVVRFIYTYIFNIWCELYFITTVSELFHLLLHHLLITSFVQACNFYGSQNLFHPPLSFLSCPMPPRGLVSGCLQLSAGYGLQLSQPQHDVSRGELVLVNVAVRMP